MSKDRPLKPGEVRAWLDETKHDILHTTPPEMPEAAQEAPLQTATKRKHTPVQLTPSASSRKARARPVTIGETHAMDKNLARRFKRGELALDATLDLHGMHVEPAYDAVLRFVAAKHDQGARHVCIITGKGSRGGGVLRDAIEGWLNVPSLRARIISAVYGRPHKGGEGAVYVLLKRHGRASST